MAHSALRATIALTMYIGRFAPSPTGPLHLGSLVAATASFLDAKAHHGQWLVRMDDLDKPREVDGAANDILNTLLAYGFEWDGDILYQSQRTHAYQEALDQLKEHNLVYPCTCSRKEIADTSPQMGIEGLVYPGTCLERAIKPNAPTAWRVKIKRQTISFDDRMQHQQSQNLKKDVGDFVLKRADDLFAYQLAVVVDDSAQQISHIVRGADLLQSTTRQIFLQQKLTLATPTYMHIPVIKNKHGEKLSKQTNASAISTKEVLPNLYQAFTLLNLNPPKSLLIASIRDSWSWAVKQWKAQYTI